MTIVVGLDTETTDMLTAKNCRIIEIAARKYNLETQEVIGSFEERINPLCQISQGAYEVHHISLNDLKDCRKWEEVAPEFYAFLEGSDLLVAHNGFEFDFPLISKELNKIGIDIPCKNGFDTMTFGRWSTADGKLPRLGELCFATDVDYDDEQAHAAMYDVDCMMRAFFNGIKLGYFKPEEEIR